MAASWQLLTDSDHDPLQMALLLLQRSYANWQYGHLSIGQLRKKMLSLDNEASSNKFLYAWSFADSLEDPIVSAFFFLRKKNMKAGGQKPKAYCLTAGAKPASAANGLTSDDLRKQLGDVCKKTLALLDGSPLLEVMHQGTAPNFKDSSGNLAGAYADAKGGTKPQKLISKGSIDVDNSVWTDTTSESLTWFSITPG